MKQLLVGRFLPKPAGPSYTPPASPLLRAAGLAGPAGWAKTRPRSPLALRQGASGGCWLTLASRVGLRGQPVWQNWPRGPACAKQGRSGVLARPLASRVGLAAGPGLGQTGREPRPAAEARGERGCWLTPCFAASARRPAGLGKLAASPPARSKGEAGVAGSPLCFARRGLRGLRD